MKKKAMNKMIAAAIKDQGDDVTRESILIELLTNGAKVSAANTAITAAFKEAGIITVTSNTALKDVREWLEKNMPEVDTYRAMRELAETLCAEHDVNDDDDKAMKAVMGAIKDQLKEEGLPVPRKIHLGETKALTLEYFGEAEESGEATSVDGLAEYLIANVEGAGEDADDKVVKALTVTAGTFYNFIYLAWNHFTVDELN